MERFRGNLFLSRGVLGGLGKGPRRGPFGISDDWPSEAEITRSKVCARFAHGRPPMGGGAHHLPYVALCRASLHHRADK
jgi:hypothetical protein